MILIMSIKSLSLLVHEQGLSWPAPVSLHTQFTSYWPRYMLNLPHNWVPYPRQTLLSLEILLSLMQSDIMRRNPQRYDRPENTSMQRSFFEHGHSLMQQVSSGIPTGMCDPAPPWSPESDTADDPGILQRTFPPMARVRSILTACIKASLLDATAVYLPENDHIFPIGNWSSLPNMSWDHPAAGLGRWPWACWRSGSWRVCCGTGIYKYRISHAPLSFDCSQSHTLS